MPDLPTVRLPHVDGLRWQPLDAVPIEVQHELWTRAWDHDGHHETPTAEAMRISAGYGDPSRDGVVATDDDGAPRALVRAQYRTGPADLLKVTVRGVVDPGWRGRGIGSGLLDWGFERADDVVAGLRVDRGDVPATVGVSTEDHVEPDVRLVRTAGLRPTRWFSGMRLDLGPDATPAGAATAPEGLRVATWEDPSVRERARIAHNEAFRDHWASTAFAADDWERELDGPEFRPALSVALIDPALADEPVVAYSLNSEYEQDWVRQGSKELYVDALGVLRSRRGRGLARWLLDWTAARAAERGHPAVALDVDTENPNGALGLYERAGYRRVHGETWWERP